MSRRLLRLAAQFPNRIGKGIYIESQIELTESKRRVPVSPTMAQLKMMGQTRSAGTVPGSLRASGKVDPPIITRDRISCAITYGNASVAYAAVQHERLDFFHTNGQAKYLESVLNESRPHMAARITRRIHFDKGNVPW